MDTHQNKSPIILSVGGGKGGVGKSMVCSNLAVQYAQAGFKTVLIDLDVGAANLHTIFGIRQPPRGLGEYFTTPRSQLIDYLIKTSVENLYLVPGSGFVPELANLKHLQKVKIINQMRSINADLILLDLGAGSSINVVDFFSMTNAGIIVTTPEPTAIVNTYEFLKNVIYRILFRMFRGQDELFKVIKETAIPKDNKTTSIGDLIEAVRKINPWAAENIQDVCDDLNFYVLFNQGRKPNELELIKKLHNISNRYIGIPLNVSGIIFHNEEVQSSVIRMCPISISSPESITTKTIRKHAMNILNNVASQIKGETAENSFEEQYQRALNWANKDYVENLLTQKRIRKDQDRRDSKTAEIYQNSTADQ
ncbi:MAG: P-loop NTPase [Chlamydiota bacterium]|nr:P-loop NTPase [Chlamydiota bacterium]